MKAKGVYSYKILELTAKEIGAYFTGTEICKILEEFGIPKDEIQYPNTKWWTINEAFKGIKQNHQDPDSAISRLIMVFLHPLSHNLNNDNAEELAKKVGKIIKYDDFWIEDAGTEYLIFTGQEEDEMHAPSKKEIEEKEKDDIFDEQVISDHKDEIKLILDKHQALMDVVELFCANPKKPTKELNDAYVFLIKNIEDSIKKLGLKRYFVSLYKPFKKDLYTAEVEWNGSGDSIDIRLNPPLSWDAVRPSLHRVHSQIAHLYSLTEDPIEMSDEDKKMEQINALISEKRTQREPSVKENVQKLEIFHKHVKDTSDGLYITKRDDDFSYKGRYINLSKKADYYKVFSALYAKLPEGGEISYKELGTEIQSRIKKTKTYSLEEMQKFIQTNLTERANGFVRYAAIPETEDNGRPLIKVERGRGIIFNNRMG